MNGLLKFHKHSDRQYRNLRDRKTYGTGKRPTGQEDLRDRNNLRDRKTYGTGRPTGQEKNLRGKKDLRDRKTYGTGTYRKLQENQVKQDRGYLVSPKF